MDRQDFIDKLRATLSGRLPSSAVADNVNYYEDYINVEIRKGRAEADVLMELGDPRLIAKTIIQTSGSADSSYSGADSIYSTGSAYSGTDRAYNTGSAYSGTDRTYSGGGTYRSAYDGDNGYNQHVFKIPGWLATILFIFATILILSAVFSILSFLIPLILVMGVVIFMVKLFRDWLN